MKLPLMRLLYRRAKPHMDITTYIEPGAAEMTPDDRSVEGLNVPEVVMEHGRPARGILTIAPVGPSILKTVREARRGYRSIAENPPYPRRAADADFIESVRAYARSLGCNGVGFTRVEPWMVFSGKAVMFPNAIVLTMEMKHDEIDRAPSKETQKEIFRTYLGLGTIVNRVADMLREHGYGAQAGPALGGEAIYPVLAERAGLGAVGTSGLLISPGVGPSQRIAAVYTTIENLPLTESNPHAWIPEFCTTCGLCVRTCPARAIFKRPITRSDGTRQHIDYRKCAVPFANAYGCTICVKECAFFTTDYEDLHRAHEARVRSRGTPRR